ncbi:unnamed protein product [Durusdinium trenchii]|uniref:Uncharacterized protein n=2 Tax=Durusdinium trenchii TaxID=1381693 RepID=A0ABP0HEA8_9DINO
MEEEEELWSWLQEVCEAQSFSNPGWVTPEDDFQRLRASVPEWLLEEDHRFAWRVVSLLGMYGELSFNLHAQTPSAESSGLTYLSLQFTGADYSVETDPPENWEQRLSCGHLFVGPQYTVDLIPGGAVSMVPLNDLKEIIVSKSLGDYLRSLKQWLEDCLKSLPRDQWKNAWKSMKTGIGGPSHSAYLVTGSFISFPDYLLKTLPPSLQAAREAALRKPKTKKKRKRKFCCAGCDTEAAKETLRCCTYCGEENDCAYFCSDCCKGGCWCSVCGSCYQCCDLSHSPPQEGEGPEEES